MANLTVRNVDDEAIKVLKARAKTHNRSLEAEVRQMINNLARDTRKSTAELILLADRIAAMTPDVPQTDSTLLIREDRDR